MEPQSILLISLNGLILPILYILWKRLSVLHDNELREIEKKLIAIEAKLDAHIIYHLERK